MSDCLFNLYAEYISEMLSRMSYKMESRLPGEIINNHRYADDITLMAESKEELKSLLMMVKEESERASLKLYILYVTLYTNILSFLTAMIDYRNT